MMCLPLHQASSYPGPRLDPGIGERLVQPVEADTLASLSQVKQYMEKLLSNTYFELEMWFQIIIKLKGIAVQCIKKSELLPSELL